MQELDVKNIISFLSHRQRVEEEHPVGGDGSDESAAEVGEDSLWGEVAIAERVEHGGVSAEEAAPAHADGGEDGDSVAVNPAVRYEVGYQLRAAPTAPSAVMGNATRCGSWKPKSHSNTKSILLASHGSSSTP